MKKLALIMTITASVMLAACGSKDTENVETSAAAQETTAAAETEASGNVGDYSEASLPEEYEQEIFEGTVTDCGSNFITVEGESGTMAFDISAAGVDEIEEPIVRGCYVEVAYADAPAGNTYPADTVSLLNDNEQLAQEQDRDPVIYGKLQHIDVNELEIIDDTGRTVDFDNVISRSVSFAELAQGDDVIVTYAGTVDTVEDAEDEEAGVFDGIPVAIKVVAADAAKTEDAEANYIEGTVSSISGTDMILSTEIADLNCSASEDILSGVEEEQKVRVYYTGALSDIVVSVEKIEPAAE